MTPADLKICKRDEKNRPLVKRGYLELCVAGHDEQRAFCYERSSGEWYAGIQWHHLSPVPPDEAPPVPPPQYRHESDPPKKRIIQPGERFIYFAADFKDPVVHTNASIIETRNEHWPIVPAQDKPARKKAKPVPQWNVFAKLKAADHENADLRAKLATAEREKREVCEMLAEARAIIDRHDLCHNLHGKVDARAFADGCTAEQRKLYGCAPDADSLATLRAQHGRLCEASLKMLTAVRWWGAQEDGIPEDKVGPAFDQLESLLVGHPTIEDTLGSIAVQLANYHGMTGPIELHINSRAALTADAKPSEPLTPQEAYADDIYGGDLPAPPHGQPPEGRTVEPEMREPRVGDTFWLRGTGWTQAANDHTARRYVLRPLPPKPEGEGWRWAQPREGDEVQGMSIRGVHEGRLFIASRNWDAHDIPHDGYRWCRAPQPPVPLPPKPEGAGWEWRRPNKGDEMQYAGGDHSISVADDSYTEGSPDFFGHDNYRWCRKPTPASLPDAQAKTGAERLGSEAVPAWDGTMPSCADEQLPASWSITGLPRQPDDIICNGVRYVPVAELVTLLRDAQRLYSLGVSRAPHGEPEADLILTRLRAAVERLEKP